MATTPAAAPRTLFGHGRRPWAVLAALMSFASPGLAIDLAPLWDFGNPALSEQRFQAALATARGDDALILQTQIARTHSLRHDFAHAREVLAALEPALASAGAEARVRHALERGRTYASGRHKPEELTPHAVREARAAWEQALALARTAQLDALAVDALHMFAFIDTAPADQLRWTEQALAVALASTQPAARRWEASLRANIGYALHDLGRFEDALAQFEAVVPLREQQGDPAAVRVAHWAVARSLRALGRAPQALAIQLRLEREGDAAGQPDRYVYEELEQLYRAAGEAERAQHYARKRAALPA